jgi:hypothetical protein
MCDIISDISNKWPALPPGAEVFAAGGARHERALFACGLPLLQRPFRGVRPGSSGHHFWGQLRSHVGRPRVRKIECARRWVWIFFGVERSLRGGLHHLQVRRRIHTYYTDSHLLHWFTLIALINTKYTG